MNTNLVIPSWLAILQVPSLIFLFGVCWGLYNGSKLVKQPTTSHRIAAWAAIGLVIAWYGTMVFLGTRNVFWIQPGTNPRLALPVGLGIIIPLLLFSQIKPLREVLQAMPLAWLVEIQVIRIIGVVFFILYLQGHLPPQFAIPASIGDAIVSITALPLGQLIRKKHPHALKLAAAWALFGMADHIMAISLGLLTSPGPLQHLFSFGGTNLITTAYPLVLFPIFRVPIGIVINIFVLRKVAQLRKAMVAEQSVENEVVISPAQ